MDALVRHPLFDNRVSYRRMLEVQRRLLGKVLQREIADYPVRNGSARANGVRTEISAPRVRLRAKAAVGI